LGYVHSPLVGAENTVTALGLKRAGESGGLQGHALSDHLRIGERPVELF
jgi:hypothetical protein